MQFIRIFGVRGTSGRRRLFSLALLASAAGAVAVAMAFSAQGADFAAKASARPGFQYLHDSAGTVFTFTVHNTGSSARIGAVEIDRPSRKWTVTGCPQAPWGWSADFTASRCRYRSNPLPLDDIAAGDSRSQFAVRATTAGGTSDRTARWPVIVSRSNGFNQPGLLAHAGAQEAGLDVTAYSWEITDAVVSSSATAAGSACPSADKTAGPSSTGNVIVVCGRNHANVPLTPVGAHASLSGSLVASHGAFASGLVPANSGNVVLGNWSDVEITSAAGVHKTLIAQLGSAAHQTSPVMTLTGYRATNQPPAAGDDNYSTDEDAPLTVAAPGVLGNDTDADGNAIHAVAGAGPGHGAVTLNADGSFTYTPNADFTGTDSFTYQASDGISTGNTATVSLTVNAVNDAPVNNVPDAQTTIEDNPLVFSTGNANRISISDVDAGTGPVDVDIAVTHGSLALSQSTGLSPDSLPAAADLTFSGTLGDVNAALSGLSYSPAANYHGSDLLTVTVNDDGNTGTGGSLSDTDTVAVTVLAANDAPSFTLPALPDQTVLEDAAAQTVDGFATDLSAGPADESGQSVTFHVTNDNSALFSAQPSIDETTGDLTYTPAADANGSALVSVKLSDDGGTANGGTDTSTTETFSVTVIPVNDAPGFSAGSDQTALEDAGPQSVPASATGITAGPADESGQVLTFHTSTDNDGLFAALPALDTTTGDLTYTPAVDRNGTATVSVYLTDNGGTANGGSDTSAVQTFTITVTSVNDAPSFLLPASADQSVLEDAAAQAVPGFATAIAAGPADESGQTLTFAVDNDNHALFSTQPTIDETTGDLTYTPAPDANGSAQVDVTLSDEGGVANGGSDTSITHSFAITVTPVNDAPSFALPGSPDQSVVEDSPAQTVSGFASNMSPGPVNESAQTITVHVANDNHGLFSTQPAIDEHSGDLTYTPAAGATGSAAVTVSVSDNGGTANGGVDTSPEATFTITVHPPNAAPTDIALSPDSVDENSPAATTVGTLTSTDADPGDTHTYALVSGTGDDDNALFTLTGASGDVVKTAASFDYETKTSYTIRVQTTDSGPGNLTFAKAITIHVLDVNDAPTDIQLSTSSIAENSGADAVIGSFSTTDQDTGDTHSYTLVSGTGSTDNAAFNITAGGDLRENASFDFEAQNSYSIRVRSTDSGSLFTEKQFTITVNDVNEAPTDIQLSNNAIDENSGADALIGALTTTDADAADTHAYTLVAGTGSTDNGVFNITASGGLRENASFDFEAKNAYSIRVRSTDSGALFTEKQFTITVTNLNEAPTDIALSNNSIAENSGANAVIGTFTTTDQDVGDTFAYSLVAGTGSTDNAAFNITAAGALRENTSFNFEGQNSYSIRVRSTDSGTLFIEKQFTITVTDVNEAPTDIQLSNNSIAENSGVNALIGTLTTTDQDAGDSHSYTLASGTGSADNGSFNITASGGLQENASFDFEAKNSYSIRIRTTDSGALFTERQFTITVSNVDEAPTNVALSSNSIAENSGANAVIGSVSTTDPDVGDTFAYTLVAGTGSTDNAAFNITAAGALRENASFNFEGQNSYSIRVRSTDSGTLFFEKQFTISVTDVNEAPTDIQSSGNSINENTAGGTTIGNLTSSDPDNGQTFSYTLPNTGCGGGPFGDNASFSIATGALKSAVSFNYEVKKTYTICIRSTDSGSPALSFDKQFTININDVNDPPVAVGDSYSGAIGNTLATLQVTASGPRVALTGNVVTTNDTDEDTGVFAHALSAVAETVASTGGGTATINSDGSFTFLPGVGDKNQNDTFTYHVTDGTATTAGTVTVHIENFLVWYVDNSSATATHDGRSSSPLLNLSSLNGAGGSGDSDAAGDIIFVYRGNSVTTPYTGGIPLEANESLLGQSNGLTVNGNALVAAGANPAVITNSAGNGIALANGVDVEGITVSGTSGDGLNGSAITTATVGTATPVTIQTAGGDGVDLSGAAGGNISIGASITGSTGHSVTVAGRTSGTVAFSGAISDTGTGIALSSNTGATVNFTGGITANTGTKSAFSATGGGTVNVTGANNNLTTTTGTTLTVANTNIGSSGLTFKSISSTGAASGIVLNNTGNGGGLTVTGDGGASANHSGGQILNSTGPGVSLNSTTNVSLGYLDIKTGLDDGIHGEGLTGFTLNRSNVLTNGNSTSDDGIQLGLESGTTSITGAISITNSSVSGNAHNNVHIRSTSGTMSSLTVTNSTFSNLNDTTGANSFLFEGSGTSTLSSATMSGNTFANNSPQRALEVQGHDTANVGDFTVSGNTFVDNGIHASFTQDTAANLTFSFLNNGSVATPMTGSTLQAINVFSSSQATGGTIVGTISGNRIGNPAIPGSGGGAGAISAVIQGQTDATLLIDGNIVRQTSGDARGIGVAFRGAAPPLATGLGPNNVVSDLTLTNNDVVPGAAPSGFPLSAIMIEADNQTNADNKSPTIRADIRGNTVPTGSAFDLLPTQLAFYEYNATNAHGIGQLVDTPPVSADATTQLTSTNTGSASAFGVALIAGPINTP